MRLINLYLIFISAFALSVLTPASGYQVSFLDSSLMSNLQAALEQPTYREKRQVESFDTEDQTYDESQDAPEEAGFWDKVVKVALKIFSKFMEWLNS